MPRFDATINGKSLVSYGITPTTATVPQPEAKTYQADIPGRDGMLDYTDAFGVIRYDNRTVTVEAYEIGDIAARIDHRRAICSDMHGKSCMLSLSTLDGYTFTGRCNVEYEEDGSQTVYTLSFDCEPYMSAGERTFYANCAGGADLVFISGDKPVKPRIEVPRRSIIVFDGKQYEVDKGTWTFDDIIFKRGRNELYVNTYTEPGTTTWGDLQSMTWEQIAWHHRQDTVSGELVNINNALKARDGSLTVDGKSAQVVTTGKNLLNNINKNPVTSNGITFELKNDGTLAVYGTATAVASLRVDYLTDYDTAVSACPSGMVTASGIAGHQASITFGAFKQDGSIIANVAQNDGTFQYPADAVKMRTFVQVQSGVTINDVLKLQLELGSTATSYEPYTGGKPSPSPEYPQEVDVVDSPVMVQATGKNLSGYPYKTFTAPAIETRNGVTFEAKPDGTIVANGTATANADVDLKWGDLVVPVKGLAVNISGCPQGGSGTTYLLRAQGSKDNKVFDIEAHDYGTGATISGANFIRTYMRIAAGTTANNLVFKPQIEIGSAATSYEPYTSNQQTITLPSDHNYLASLPDGTRDELVLRSDGVAVLVERVGKRVFNGSEAWIFLSGVAYGFRLRDTTLSGDYRQLICDRYTVREFAATSETQGATASSQNAPNLFCFRDTTIAQTVDAWKAKLAASNVTVYYALATTTVRYSADNGTTWSTTDPAAGTSAIPLQKGTNNVWCTGPLSPTITLDYDTQERTRKRRISELYWLGNEPKKRITWGQLATRTWRDIGSKSVQEWYFSGTAEVVENAYINYEIGDL